MAESTPRYLTLDIFRGITICFMIIVNSPGGPVSFGPLEHAAWHGFTPTDLVFPSFLFAVGNAMAFAMHKYELQGESVFWNKLIRRSLLIFLLGYLMYWFPFFTFDETGSLVLSPLSETRIFGVLQRIALCYFFGSIILHYFSKKWTIVMSVILLLGYWIVMNIFGDAADPYSLLGNAALKLDLLLLGPSHLYHGEGVAFDPEGMLSTFPAIVNVIAGYLAGDFIRKKGNAYETIAKLMLAGSALILVALTWDMVFPINKKLWTSSFVLLTSGLDLLILSTLMYIIEIRNYRSWTTFFNVFGKNPLFIYLLSEILLTLLYLISVGNTSLHDWIYQHIFVTWLNPIQASFWFAFFYMLFCWLIGYFLYKRKIYIKV